MYFDFESRHVETPTVESAMSWRERALLSFFTHLLFALLVVLGPRLQFVQDAMARRAERLAEMAEAAEMERLALRRAPDAPEFIFVDTLADPASAPPPAADLSDADRAAQSPTQADDPLNDRPNAEGNSFEFAQTPDPADGRDPSTSRGEDAPEAAEAAPAEEAAGGFEDGAPEGTGPEASAPDPGEGEGAAAPPPGERWARRRPLGDRPGTILDRALRGLDSVARNPSYYNLRGRTDRYGPDIQFDSKGVDFASWLARFRSQIYRNWFIPYAAMSMSGNVVLTFNVHVDGRLTDLAVERPSAVDAFTNSAFNAIRGSNPTYPLPPEYPDDSVFFTVTFYFNERPPGR